MFPIKIRRKRTGNVSGCKTHIFARQHLTVSSKPNLIGVKKIRNCMATSLPIALGSNIVHFNMLQKEALPKRVEAT